MDNISKKVTKILLGGIVISFIFIFLYFYIKTGNSIKSEIYNIIPIYRKTIILNLTLIKSLEYLPVIIIFVYTISFSFLFSTRGFQEESFKFFRIATPSYIILIIFLIITIFFQLLLKPYMYRKNEIIHYNALKSYKAYIRAIKLKNKGHFNEAIDAIEIIFKLDQSNRKASMVYDEIIKEKTRAGITIQETMKNKRSLPVKPVIGYYEKGKIEYENKHYYAALYYFERALKLHKNNEELKELYKRCLQKVKTALGALTEREKERKKLIKNKERGLKYLYNKDYYKAYFTFDSILKKYPKLEDIQLYKKLAEKKLAEIDFLPEEILKYSWLPGWKNIIFIDDTGFLNTIEKVIFHNETYYFYGIKRYYPDKGYGRSGFIYFKYGKWLNNHIRLKNKRRYSEIPKGKEHIYTIQLDINPWYIINGIPGDKLQNQLNIYEVFRYSDKLNRYGYNISPKYRWLAEKLGIFFALYAVTLFISSIVWYKRSIHDFPPIVRLIMFFMAIPFTSYFSYLIAIDINKIIIYTHQYFNRFIFKINIFVYVLLFELILSTFTTVLFLMQKNE